MYTLLTIDDSGLSDSPMIIFNMRVINPSTKYCAYIVHTWLRGNPHHGRLHISMILTLIQSMIWRPHKIISCKTNQIYLSTQITAHWYRLCINIHWSQGFTAGSNKTSNVPAGVCCMQYAYHNAGCTSLRLNASRPWYVRSWYGLICTSTLWVTTKNGTKPCFEQHAWINI